MHVGLLRWIAVGLTLSISLACAPWVMADDASPDKLPAPADVAAAEALVKEAFKLPPHANPSDLLGKMRQQATDSKNDEATQYAILLEAARLAKSAGDAETLIWVSDELAARYPHASVKSRLTMFDGAVRQMKNADARHLIGDALLGLADDAAWAQDFAVAAQAADWGKVTAPAGSGPDKSQIFHELATSAATAPKKGDANPTTPKDSLRLGAGLCFGDDKWLEGLPLLAEGDDPQLADLAKKEIAGPGALDQFIALGDGYMAIAKSTARSALIRSGCASRAAYWYDSTHGRITGLQAAYAEKKRVEARDMVIWSTRAAALDALRDALLKNQWGWHGPDVQMTFREDGSVSHRGMHGTWRIVSPRELILSIDNGDAMYFHFNAKLSHYTSLCRGFGGDRLPH